MLVPMTVQSQDFSGKQFNWFTGVIENRHDPLFLGRVQVRIIGLHDSNKNLIPTKDLPWAQILNAPNASSSFSTARDGDWVFGFFQDGKNAQLPVITGVYPGIHKARQQLPNDTVKPSSGFQDQRSNAEFKTSPQPPEGVLVQRPDEPTTPALGRETMSNTVIEMANQQRSVACDFALGVKMICDGAKLLITQIAESVRNGLKALLQALGIAPSAAGAMNIIKSLRAFIDDLTETVKVINEGVVKVLGYIKQLTEIIAYILSLPDEVMRLFMKCLNDAKSQLQTNFLDAVSSDTSILSSEDQSALKELSDKYSELQKQTSTLVSNSSTVYNSLTSVSGTMSPTQTTNLIKELYPNSTHSQIKMARL